MQFAKFKCFSAFLRHPHINIEFVCNGNQVVQLKKRLKEILSNCSLGVKLTVDGLCTAIRRSR